MTTDTTKIQNLTVVVNTDNMTLKISGGTISSKMAAGLICPKNGTGAMTLWYIEILRQEWHSDVFNQWYDDFISHIDIDKYYTVKKWNGWKGCLPPDYVADPFGAMCSLYM